MQSIQIKFFQKPQKGDGISFQVKNLPDHSWASCRWCDGKRKVFHPLSTAAVITCWFEVHIHTLLDRWPLSSNDVQEGEDIEEQGLLCLCRKRVFPKWRELKLEQWFVARMFRESVDNQGNWRKVVGEREKDEEGAIEEKWEMQIWDSSAILCCCCTLQQQLVTVSATTSSHLNFFFFPIFFRFQLSHVIFHFGVISHVILAQLEKNLNLVFRGNC